MLIIVKDEPLTESKKVGTYKYAGWFKLINRIGKLIQELEQIDENLTQYDSEKMRIYRVRELNQRLDRIEQEIEYAKKITWEEKPFWETGNLDGLLRKNAKRKKK